MKANKPTLILILVAVIITCKLNFKRYKIALNYFEILFSERS